MAGGIGGVTLCSIMLRTSIHSSDSLNVGVFEQFVVKMHEGINPERILNVQQRVAVGVSHSGGTTHFIKPRH